VLLVGSGGSVTLGKVGGSSEVDVDAVVVGAAVVVVGRWVVVVVDVGARRSGCGCWSVVDGHRRVPGGRPTLVVTGGPRGR
jgi:hypothetical protein